MTYGDLLLALHRELGEAIDMRQECLKQNTPRAIGKSAKEYTQNVLLPKAEAIAHVARAAAVDWARDL